MKIGLMIASAVIAMSTMTGCATLAKVFTPANAPILQAGVDVAVALAVGTDVSTQKAKALAIKTIALQVAADASNPSATIATLEAGLNARVMKLAPNPLDAAAFMALASTLQGFLNSKVQAVSSGVLTPQTLVDISALANDVALAASFFGV
jgi:predicted component of type VI protein secretion system